MHIFTAQVFMELCLKLLVICSTHLLHLQMGDDMTQPHKKALSKPFIGELNLLIVF